MRVHIEVLPLMESAGLLAQESACLRMARALDSGYSLPATYYIVYEYAMVTF